MRHFYYNLANNTNTDYSRAVDQKRKVMDMEQKGYDFAKLSDEELKHLSLLENEFSRDKNEDIILVAYRDQKGEQ